MNNVYKLHARLIKTGHSSDPLSLRHLLLLSCSSTSISSSVLSYAHSIFSQIPSPNTFAYNTLIRAHASLSPSLSLFFFHAMRRADVSPDHFTFPFLLKAFSNLQLAHACRYHVHSLIFKLGFHSNVYVNNALIAFYGSLGLVDVALKVFDEMPTRDIVSWSSMISCFTKNGLARDALALFQEMQIEGGNLRVDYVTMLAVLSAISSLGVLELGRWVEGYVKRIGLEVTVSLGTAFIDMYSRCGSVDDFVRVFDEMPRRNVLTWTAMIQGLAVHGRSREALRVFYEMKRVGLVPDDMAFRGALVACAHGGLVEEGWRVFESIEKEYGMELTLEHYGCMVDVLGRAGLVRDAFEFVERMPKNPNVVIWRTLLGACVNHGYLELAEKVREKIHRLDPYHDGDYVLLSNAYGGVGRYKEKAEVRSTMRERRIGKEPGYSMLIVDQEIHEFVSGDDSHPKSEEIRRFLAHVIDGLRVEGYAPHASNVFHDIEEEEKEQIVSYHSEKLAVALALLTLEDRRTIRIMKNLRICHDCHCFMKHVSSKFNKEIIVRDRNRFHHFSNGICSCQDYW